MGIWLVSRRSPGGLRSFDPLRIADLEYRMWVGYYLRRWTHVLAAALSLLRLGFGRAGVLGGGHQLDLLAALGAGLGGQQTT